MKILQKIFSNVLKDPSERKFRQLNRAKVGRLLEPVGGALGLLVLAGFEVDGDGEHFVLDVENAGLENLQLCLSELQKRRAVVSEAEEQLRKVQQANAERIKEARRKKKKARESIKAKMAAAKSERDSRPVQASVAQPLKFGAHLKAFEPPKQQSR